MYCTYIVTRSSLHMWISRCLYTSSRASPRWSHAHFSAISLCSPSCLASPCLGLQRLYLDSCSLYHSPPRSITPRPDSIPSPPRPIAVPHPRRPQSTLPSHVNSTWQPSPQTLEASHSCTCCTYTTHAASSPHTRTRISMHASTRTRRICPTRNFLHKNKETNIDNPCLAGLCFPCPNEWPPRGTHTCMHPCRAKHAQLHVHFCASAPTGQEFPSSSSPRAAIVVSSSAV
jgi:hypothetical protein